MQNAITNLFSTSLIPELSSDISARTTRYIELFLITVTTMRAFPHQLAIVFDNLDFPVETAYLTVVALGVEFGIHDVIVDKLHYTNNSREPLRMKSLRQEKAAGTGFQIEVW